MMQRNAMLLCAGLALSSCSSVEVPRESWWRLDIPVAGLSANSRDACVLRVQDLQLGNAMSGDFLIIAHGPSKLEARELDRWVAPLDRLATDAFIVGLSRSGAFSLVDEGDLARSVAQATGRELDLGRLDRTEDIILRPIAGVVALRV